MKVSMIAAWVLVGVVLAFLFAPIIVMVMFAFNGSESTSTMHGVGVGAFKEVLTDPSFMTALGNSLKAAALVGVIGGAFGTLAAIGLSRLPRKITGLISAFLAVPMTLPGLLLGVAMLGFFSKIDVGMSLATVVMGHLVVTLPLIILIVAARLDRLDLTVIEAARDLGAGPLLAFRRVFFPMVAPAILGSILLSLATSLDEFIITLFVNGGAYTVPVFIFAQLRFGLATTVNAIATIMLALTVGLAVLAARYVSVSDVR
jgi:spermidine/putrescine transport system permease protein